MNKVKGVAVRRSYQSVRETITILQAYLQQHGATIYARIDQKAEAAKVGLTLLPLEFILFGNPKTGVPVMKQNPLSALDLPLQIVVWEDEMGKVWITYNKASYMRKRYALPKTLAAPLNIEPVLEAALACPQLENTSSKVREKGTSVSKNNWFAVLMQLLLLFQITGCAAVSSEQTISPAALVSCVFRKDRIWK